MARVDAAWLWPASPGSFGPGCPNSRRVIGSTSKSSYREHIALEFVLNLANTGPGGVARKKYMMHVTVRYFALVREITGQRTEERDVPEGTSAGELIDQVVADYPAVVGGGRASQLKVYKEKLQPQKIDGPRQ